MTDRTPYGCVDWNTTLASKDTNRVIALYWSAGIENLTVALTYFSAAYRALYGVRGLKILSRRYITWAELYFLQMCGNPRRFS